MEPFQTVTLYAMYPDGIIVRVTDVSLWHDLPCALPFGPAPSDSLQPCSPLSDASLSDLSLSGISIPRTSTSEVPLSFVSLPEVLPENVLPGKMLPAAVLAVAPVPGPEQELQVTGDDLQQAERFGDGFRRRQFLGWRALVRRVLGTEANIRYDRTGAPVVMGHDRRLGVSHDSGLIAVSVSGGRCGVDVERMDRNFSRVRSRYISTCEEALAASADPLFAAALWCGKEALYKFAGRQGLDFLKDIRIIDVRFEPLCDARFGEGYVGAADFSGRYPDMIPCGRLIGSVCGEPPVLIGLYRIGNHLLAWTTGRLAEKEWNLPR